ncbi:MAG TPA: hypothetical protein VNZ58_08125 [Thermomicrobiales bacterium]|nr:hypothetical protein [Thermomicrobiales bacterium]
MALYLVVHTPRKDEEEKVFPPTKMVEMARDHGGENERTRWLTTWSPDIHDERHFTLWSANSAEDIREVMSRYHFLSEMDSEPVCVQEWKPGDVLAVESDD